MLDIHYTMNPQESAEATVDYLTNRVAMSIMFGIMQLSCLFLCLIFAITAYNRAAQPQDYAAVIFAVMWILYYKQINRWVVKRALKHRRFSGVQPSIKIDHKRIICTGQMPNAVDIEWKSLRNILKNKNGYIIPLTGFKNAGKFIWLPFRGFDNESSIEKFVELAQKFKIKIKNIK